MGIIGRTGRRPRTARPMWRSRRRTPSAACMCSFTTTRRRSMCRRGMRPAHGRPSRRRTARFWRRMRRWTRAQKPCGFARRTEKGGCLSRSFAFSARGTRRAGCSNGRRRLKRRICWRWRRTRMTKSCFWAARFPIMRGKWARRCRWPTSCRRCRIGGWSCWTGFGSAG